jgi:hypothetical protein
MDLEVTGRTFKTMESELRSNRKKSIVRDSEVEEEEEEKIPLTVILEYRNTFASQFKPSESLLEVCDQALRSSWHHEQTQPAEWKVTDRYGNKLPMDVKLKDLPIYKQDTIFMSKKLGNASDENVLVKIEDKIEQKV